MRVGVHDTPRHLARLEEAVATHAGAPPGRRGRAARAQAIRAGAAALPPLPALAAARLPRRSPSSTTSCSRGRTPPDDARAVCLIDLDTVGPLSLAYELGDAWRSWCNRAGEDDVNAALDLEIMRASLDGYRRRPRARARPRRAPRPRCSASSGSAWSWPPASPPTPSFESYFGWDAARFPGRGEHNLVRARGQWSLHQALLASADRARGDAGRWLSCGRSSWRKGQFFAVGPGRWLNRLMLEQADTGENRGVAIVSLKLALSHEARESLAAVRVAQESAQRRARRQTMQARMGVALLAGAVVAGAISWGPRLAQWRQSRVHVAKAVRTPARISSLTSSPTSMPSSIPTSRPTSPVPPEPAVVAAAKAPVAQPALAAPSVVAKAAADESGAPAEGCDTSSRRGLWRRSPEACARAFAADPQNASLALAVAQAEHAHARLDEAAQWAKRALALDPNAAEAYVIIAHADTENGRVDDARAAYQRYLEVAPHGWHKAEARAALRRASVSSR